VILPHIDKEKQVVALIEKLCSRFKDKVEEIECYNLALCIVHLPISSKSIKAVKDSIECYAEKLKYPTVKAQFDELVTNARKQLKMEGKVSTRKLHFFIIPWIVLIIYIKLFCRC
jgi:hypothetical protein